MRKSRNDFDFWNNEIHIKIPAATEQDPDHFVLARTTARQDYTEELMSVTWGLKRKRTKDGTYQEKGYPTNKKLGLLHLYIMQKWYGEELCKRMKDQGFVVDHMDNDPTNSCIDNLCFLMKDENTAKGQTLDKKQKEKQWIALTMFKDFSTDLLQMTVHFNFPAKGYFPNLQEYSICAEEASLLYDTDYEIMISDAKIILKEYEDSKLFRHDLLHCVDYELEFSAREMPSTSDYQKWISGDLEGPVAFFYRRYMTPGWKIGENRRKIHILNLPQELKKNMDICD